MQGGTLPSTAIMSPGILHRKLLWYGPSGILFLSYVAVCFQAHTPWPWTHVIHEDGQRLLVETIFYFEHAVRELPMDLILGIAVAGSARYFYPPRPSMESRAERLRLWNRFMLASLAVIGTILAGALIDVGFQGVLNNLAQVQTRPGEPLRWGAHWRFHLLERIAVMSLAFSATGLSWLLAGRPVSASPRTGRYILILAWALFAALSLFYGFSWEPFTNAIFLGHQARELLTHALVTLPLALGTVFVMANRFWVPSGTSRLPFWPIYASAFIAIALALYLAIGTVLTGAHGMRQSESLVAAISSHFFEHFLGYLIVSLTAGLVYLSYFSPIWSVRRDPKTNSQRLPMNTEQKRLHDHEPAELKVSPKSGRLQSGVL